jgi:hypothetical protein
MAKGKKVNMAEKRRQRAKRLPARPVTSTPRRPESDDPNPDQVEVATSSTAVEAKDTTASTTTPSSSSTVAAATKHNSSCDLNEKVWPC